MAEDKVRGLSPYDFDRLLRAVLKAFGISFESGTATGGSDTTLQDTGQNWRVNVWPGALIRITIGGIKYTRLVSANTADTVTFDALPAGVAVSAGCEYFMVAPVDLTRWGRSVSPAWTHAGEQVAPGPGTALVTQAVSAGRTGYIYGFFITVQEANDFKISWTSGGAARSKRIVFGGGGTMEDVQPAALNEGLPADSGSNVTITNVNAGGAGKIYQANLLYAEV